MDWWHVWSLMLGLLFVGDLGSAQLFSTWRKCKAQRVFACCEQAPSQCSAANTNQPNYRNTHPSHWRHGFRKANRQLLFADWNTVLYCAKTLTGGPYGSVHRGFPLSVSFGKKMGHLTYLSYTLFYNQHSHSVTILHLSSQILLAFP